MADYTPNIDAVQRRIRQRDAALIPNEHDPELRQAYETLIQQYQQVDSDILRADDIQHLLEAPQYVDDAYHESVEQVLRAYAGAVDQTTSVPASGSITWDALAAAGERTLEQYDDAEDAYRTVIRVGLARRSD